MKKDTFKAKFILGNEEKTVKGEDAFDIINKIFPEIQYALDIANGIDNENDKAEAQSLYDWKYKDFEIPGDMQRFDRFDFNFSFGSYACLSWSLDD